MAVSDDEEKTHFLQQDGSGRSLEQIAAENPDYTRVYMNNAREGGKVRLSLSKGAGDVLYIVSNRNHDDLRLYFASSKGTAVKSMKAREKTTASVETNVKRAKQQSLLSFFNKK